MTITSRIEDLPSWFELHPTEVWGRAARVMSARIKAGYEPGDIMDGPNIWRVWTGHRLAWVGPSRPGLEAVEDILSIVRFGTCAMVIGESNRLSVEDIVGFGSLTETGQSPENVARCRHAYEVIRDMGIPRSFTEEWMFG